MKRILCIFLALMLLTACGSHAPKKAKTEILFAADGSLLATLDDAETVSMLINTDSWETLEALPDGLTPEYKLLTYQERTLLFGQDPEAERGYDLVVTMITYLDSACVELRFSDGAVGDVFDGVGIPGEILTNYFVMPEVVRNVLESYIAV